MKKTKVIIPALGLLLLSTAASVTGTVAWFAANNTVSATGMTISAKSNTEFLVIVEGNSFINTAVTTTVTSTASATSLYPVAPKNTLAANNVNTPATWQYAYSNNVASYAAATGYTDCTAQNFGDYVASETFSLGLNVNSGLDTSATHLSLKSVNVPDDTGISCVVVCGNVFGNYTADSSVELDLGVNATTSGTVVTVYYYTNGEDTNVYSSNSTNLTGEITLNFGFVEA